MHLRSLTLSFALVIGCATDGVPPQSAARDSSAQRPAPALAAAPVPRVEGPRIFPATCMGEECLTEFAAHACAPVTLRANEVDTAHVVAQVARGDKVQVTTRNLHLLEPGKVLIRRALTLDTDDMNDDRTPRKDTLHFAVGDTLYPLKYEELGRWTWRYHGVEGTGGAFWADPASRDGEDDGTAAAILLSRPRLEDWWRIVLPNGTVGWWQWRPDSEEPLPLLAVTEACPQQ